MKGKKFGKTRKIKVFLNDFEFFLQISEFIFHI